MYFSVFYFASVAFQFYLGDFLVLSVSYVEFPAVAGARPTETLLMGPKLSVVMPFPSKTYVLRGKNTN